MTSTWTGSTRKGVHFLAHSGNLKTGLARTQVELQDHIKLHHPGEPITTYRFWRNAIATALASTALSITLVSEYSRPVRGA